MVAARSPGRSGSQRFENYVLAGSLHEPIVQCVGIPDSPQYCMHEIYALQVRDVTVRESRKFRSSRPRTIPLGSQGIRAADVGLLPWDVLGFRWILKNNRPRLAGPQSQLINYTRTIPRVCECNLDPGLHPDRLLRLHHAQKRPSVLFVLWGSSHRLGRLTVQKRTRRTFDDLYCEYMYRRGREQGQQ